MSGSTNYSNVEEVFNSLVNNAIDFFKRSIAEFEKDPKYSVIHFYASIELFFKARLLLEHWSLIVDAPQKANYQKFLSGDFSSVGLDEAMGRLEGISGESFGKQEKEIFKHIREHRNRLMHFSYANETSIHEKLLVEIAAEQCRGWHSIHMLLTDYWHPRFEKYSDQIKELQSLMIGQKKYLEFRYIDLKPRIQSDQLNDIDYIECPSCGFHSGKIASDDLGLVTMECLVCESRAFRFRYFCDLCDSRVIIDESLKCSQCNSKIPLRDWLDSLTGIVEEWAYCDKCKYHDLPSIGMYKDQWFCLSCFTAYEKREVHHCGWCGGKYNRGHRRLLFSRMFYVCSPY